MSDQTIESRLERVEMRLDIKGLKVRAGIWGGIVGGITGFIGTLVLAIIVKILPF